MEKRTEEDEKLAGMTKLECKWVIWENWKSVRPAAASKTDYLQNMQAIAEFDNVIDFWRVWRTVPHADPSLFFMDPDTKGQAQYVSQIATKYRIEIKADWVRVVGLSIFRAPVLPTWEDTENREGGEFSASVTGLKKSQLRDIWHQLVVRIVGGSYPYGKNVRRTNQFIGHRGAGHR